LKIKTQRKLPVVSEVVLSTEGFSTDVTRERSFVGVRSLMDEQIVGLGELALTEAADKLLSAPLSDLLAIVVGRYCLALVMGMGVMFIADMT